MHDRSTGWRFPAEWNRCRDLIARAYAMKNLVILHLESISRQRLAEFASAFPNTLRLMGEGVVFDRFFSSATSTHMVLTYLFHANDFEVDTSTTFEGMVPARQSSSLQGAAGRAATAPI